jgi:glycine oxidase
MARVLVVGGGIMGLGAAWRLAKAGQQVTLVEKAPVFGAGASNAAAGMIGPQSEALEDDAYFAATLVSRDLWPAFAEELAKASSVEIGFQAKGALHVAYGVSYEKRLDAKYLWQKRRAGLVERLEGDALFERFPMLARRTSCAFFAHGDYWVDNEALVLALVDACKANGVRMLSGLEVTGLDRGPDGWVAGTKPTTLEGAFDQVLVATGAWAGGLVPGTGLPIKGQMISFKVPPHLMPEVPLHAENVYLVPRGSDRVLVGARTRAALARSCWPTTPTGTRDIGRHRSPSIR